MEMSDTYILSHICNIVKLERFPLKQYPLGEVVGFVLVLFCFVFALSRSRKRKYRVVALPEQFWHSCLS